MKNPIQMFRQNRGPFRALHQMQADIDRLFEEIAPMSSEAAALTFNPLCDVTEDPKQYELKFDMPGLQKDQIKVELSDNILTVSAERKSHDEKVKKAGGQRTFISEVGYGSYVRSLALPKNVDGNSVKAAYENGVLAVTVKKTEADSSKQIPVQ